MEDDEGRENCFKVIAIFKLSTNLQRQQWKLFIFIYTVHVQRKALPSHFTTTVFSGTSHKAIDKGYGEGGENVGDMLRVLN